jgi:AraC-like DNA-binding protein
MLHIDKDFYCGLFDSEILRKGQHASPDRKLQKYMLELFQAEGGICYVEGKKYPIKRGMLLCAKPGQIRRSVYPVRCNFIHIPLTNNSDSDIFSVLDSVEECIYIQNEDQIKELAMLFNQLGNIVIKQSYDNADTVNANALLLEIIYRFYRLSKPHTNLSVKTYSNRIVRSVYQYIHDNYASDCSLSTLAATVGITPNHLQSVFLKTVGITPATYTRIRRIEKAKQMIAAGESSLVEIAIETGFCSQSHFTKVFTKEVGMTPSVYQKMLLEKY